MGSWETLLEYRIGLRLDVLPINGIFWDPKPQPTAHKSCMDTKRLKAVFWDLKPQPSARKSRILTASPRLLSM